MRLACLMPWGASIGGAEHAGGQLGVFYGVTAARRLERGTLAASSTFDTEALAFGRANGINRQDGAGLLAASRLLAFRTRTSTAVPVPG